MLFHVTCVHFWVSLSSSFCVHSRISRCSNWGDSIIQVRGLTYLPLWKIITNYLHGIKLWNNLHSSSFTLLHLAQIYTKTLQFFQATRAGQIILFSPFSVSLPLQIFMKHEPTLLKTSLNLHSIMFPAATRLSIIENWVFSRKKEKLHIDVKFKPLPRKTMSKLSTPADNKINFTPDFMIICLVRQPWVRHKRY